MADGTDEDGARAAKMDEWVIWEVGERLYRELILVYYLLLPLSLC